MRNIIYILLITMIFGLKFHVYSQERLLPPTIVCPADFNHVDFHLPPPSKFKKLSPSSRINSNQKTAEIIVRYYGFGIKDQMARDAFQYAVDIWATLIKSDMPIYIDATYESLGENTLGQAGTTDLLRGFEGALNDTTYYPIALAEKLSGKDLNTPGAADISASFNKDFTWYHGLDGLTPNNKHDFVTVVLHEIGHGLGFYAIDNYDEEEEVGFRNPGAFDNFIVNGNGKSIYEFENNSIALGTFLTSNDLFINSPLTVISNGELKPKIYAPKPYNPGSSISHWDEGTYNGTVNALMTPQVGAGESVHDPGPNMMSLFADMGWVNTYLNITAPLLVDNLSDGITIELEVKSDTTLKAVSPVIHYSYDGFLTSNTENMLLSDGDKYSYSISNPGVASTLLYYIDGVQDDLGRNYSTPSNPEVNSHKIYIQQSFISSVPYTLAQGGDFETNNSFTQIPLKGNANIWELGTPTNKLNKTSSGSKAWKTDLDANLLKPKENISSVLISPKFDLSDTTADYNIKFDLSMDIDVSAAGLSVLYSVNGGYSWTTLGSPKDGRGLNWMNRKDQYILFPDGLGWVVDNSINAPVEVSYNLSEVIGNGSDKVYFGLVASVINSYNDTIYNFDGIMIDDFEITKTEPRAYFTSIGSAVNFPNDEIQFVYISKGAETFIWDFGDGTSSTAKNPKHAYQIGGSYDVSLTITYPGGTHSNTVSSAVTIIATKGSTYLTSEGGDMESNFNDFVPENIVGTGFESGSSSIEGKSGTSSGQNAWVTGIDDLLYLNQSEAFLYTPIFDFSILGNYKLSFKAKYAFEEGWDGFILEYTNNFGKTWEQVFAKTGDNWYDIIGEDNPAQGWPAIPLFTGTTDNVFVNKQVDLTTFGGKGSIGFRFHFISDHLEVDTGAAIDDFALVGPITGIPSPDFTYTLKDGCATEVVNFANISTGSIVSAEWSFGVGASPQTATGFGPHSIAYLKAGAYDVKLKVKDKDGLEFEKTNTLFIGTDHKPVITRLETTDNLSITLQSSEGDAYQWYFEGTIVEGAIDRDLVNANEGAYTVGVTIGGCTGTSDIFNASLTEITSVDKKFENAISLFPNPSNGHLFISGVDQSLKNLEIEVYDLTGKILIKSNIQRSSKNEFNLDLSALKGGSYIVKLASNNSNVMKRVIIN